MLETIQTIVQTVNKYLSDYILVFLLIGVGLWYSIKTKFVQVRYLGAGLKKIFGDLSFKGGDHGGGMSSFQAVATAIAAQVGTGNIVGSAGAILIGCLLYTSKVTETGNAVCSELWQLCLEQGILFILFHVL